MAWRHWLRSRRPPQKCLRPPFLCCPPHRAAYHAIACGADVNYSYSGQAAAQLVWEANMLAGGAAEQPLSPSNLGHTTVLHAACRVRGRRGVGLDAFQSHCRCTLELALDLHISPAGGRCGRAAIVCTAKPLTAPSRAHAGGGCGGGGAAAAGGCQHRCRGGHAPHTAHVSDEGSTAGRAACNPKVWEWGCGGHAPAAHTAHVS